MKPTALLQLLGPALLLACSTQVTGAGTPGGAGGQSGGGQSGGGQSGGGTGGSWLPDPDAGTSAAVDAYAGPTEDANCGLVPVLMDRQPSPVLLLQDRSTSMRGDVSVGTGTRWQNVSTAVKEVVTSTQSNVAWGLKFFPGKTQCTIDDGPNIAPKLDNADGIVAALNDIAGDPTGKGLTNGTPTALVFKDALTYLSTLDSPNKYIVFATDGQPTCAGNDPEADDYDRALAAAKEAADAGIKIAVVGLAFKPVKDGADLPKDQAFLNQVADMGGMANNDPANPQTHFYPAGNTDELVKAFQAIAKQIYSCTFALDKQPPSPPDVAVKLNGSKIPRDGSNGWEYTDSDMKSVTLYGSACDSVKAETGTMDIKIIMGCPGQIIP